jgi:uncharacterized protein with PIN domain
MKKLWSKQTIIVGHTYNPPLRCKNCNISLQPLVERCQYIDDEVLQPVVDVETDRLVCPECRTLYFNG